ncbi:MAG: glycosyltransferase family 39 protein, partial [Planctomycetota bacterium]
HRHPETHPSSRTTLSLSRNRTPDPNRIIRYRGPVQSQDPSSRRFLRLARSPIAALLLVIICLIAYIPGLLTMPPVDRDESRFAQASRQMVDGIRTASSPAEVVEAIAVPRIQDRPRLNKPPLIYWLQSVPASLLDHPDHDIGEFVLARFPTGNIGAYRLVSALCAIAAVLMTWRLGLRLFEPRTALLGAAMLAVCVMVMWDARQARADQLLLATTTAALWAFAAAWAQWRAHHTVKPITAVLLWIAVGAGVMSKGPITPLIIVPGILLLCLILRKQTGLAFLRALRPILGFVIVLAIPMPWLAAVAWSMGGVAEYAATLWDEVFVRAAGGKEHFVPIPGYHLALLAVLFFPGSLLTLSALKRGFAILRARRPRPETVCLSLMIPAWFVFELTPAKLPHYTLPMYPLIALLTARTVLAAQAGSLPDIRTRGFKVGTWICISIGAIIVLAAGYIIVQERSYYAFVGFTTAVIAITMTIALLLFAALAANRQRIFCAQFLLILSALGTGTLLLGVAMPNTSTLWPSSQILSETGLDNTPVYAYGYAEDSLVFLTRGQLKRTDQQHWCDWLDSASEPGFGASTYIVDAHQATAAPCNIADQFGTHIEGINTANGKWIRLRLFESAEISEVAP